jgi:hypothetical protein
MNERLLTAKPLRSNAWMQMLAAVEMLFIQLKAHKYISEQDLRGKEIVISRYGSSSDTAEKEPLRFAAQSARRRNHKTQ